MEALATQIDRQRAWLKLCYELYPDNLEDPMSWQKWIAQAVAEFLVNRPHIQAALMVTGIEIDLREMDIYVRGNSVQQWANTMQQLIVANQNRGKTLDEIIERVKYITRRIDDYAQNIVQRHDGKEAIAHRQYQLFEARTEQYLVDQEAREEQERADAELNAFVAQHFADDESFDDDGDE